jgi:hypothetical protein
VKFAAERWGTHLAAQQIVYGICDKATTGAFAG